MKKMILLASFLSICAISTTTVVAQNVAVANRKEEEIKKTFPYNIDMKMANGKVTNSEKIFKTKGKPLVVFFWLTTCGPCRMELTAIKGKYPQWKKETDFKMIAVSTDWQENYPAFVKRVEDSGWEWDAYHDMRREFSRVMPGALNGLPQVFVFDGKGNIVYQKRKYMPGDEDDLYAKIKEAAEKK